MSKVPMRTKRSSCYRTQFVRQLNLSGNEQDPRWTSLKGSHDPKSIRVIARAREKHVHHVGHILIVE